MIKKQEKMSKAENAFETLMENLVLMTLTKKKWEQHMEKIINAENDRDQMTNTHVVLRPIQTK